VIQWLDVELAMENPGQATSVIARVEPGRNPEDIQQLIQGEGWGAEPLGGVAKQLSVALKSVEFGVQVGGGILAFSALMLLIQFYGVLLRERNEDLRIMRSMGASKWSLGSALSFEIAAATVIAVAVGSAIGLMVANIGADSATSVISDRLGVELILSPTLPIGFLSLMIIAAPLFVVLGALPTIRRSLNGSLLTR
jgi:predicted lysophospholipase L1 biosynthesis ABC-type transport system permease subunit